MRITAYTRTYSLESYAGSTASRDDGGVWHVPGEQIDNVVHVTRTLYTLWDISLGGNISGI